MSTKIGIGFSDEPSVVEAAKKAAIEAKNSLELPSANLLIVLSTIHYDPHEFLQTIRVIFKNAKIIGCSTAGIIYSQNISTRGLLIIAIHSQEMKFGINAAKDLGKTEPLLVGRTLANDCIADIESGGGHGFMLLFDGRINDLSRTLKGLQDVLGNVFPIFGAGSADDFHLSKSFQIYNDTVINNSAIGLVFGGPSHVGISNAHGWKPLGKPRVIDEASGNIIKKINGKKATLLYEEYFDTTIDKITSIEFARISSFYPLGIFSEESKKYLIRKVLKFQEDGSIVCQGNILKNAEVHLMIGNKESYMDAAVEAAREANNNLLGKHAKIVIIFECMNRLKLLGRVATKEIQQIKDVFGDVPVVGMYSNSEICPFQVEEKYSVPRHQYNSINILALG